jgi:hypothetical protein
MACQRLSGPGIADRRPGVVDAEERAQLVTRRDAEIPPGAIAVDGGMGVGPDEDPAGDLAVVVETLGDALQLDDRVARCGLGACGCC